MRKYQNVRSVINGEVKNFEEKDAIELAEGDIEYMEYRKKETGKDWAEIAPEYEKKLGMDKITLDKHIATVKKNREGAPFLIAPEEIPG